MSPIRLGKMAELGSHRSMGLFGATGVGVGAIVGGGILALAGIAFTVTGPGAIVAFALNGVIAVITALSFAEIASRFPESGGTYTFAKKVFSVEAAFFVGWVVWFASVVAAVLYAIGFATFAAVAIHSVWNALLGDPPTWIEGRWLSLGLAIGATAAFALLLSLRAGSGGAWINVAKLLVFAVLIAGGLAMLTKRSPESIRDQLTPFFSHGFTGLIQAMGFTFIALQGFDLIAAVGGEVRDPQKNLPRAMLLSLGIAMIVYLPLLLVTATSGLAPDEYIGDASKGNEAKIVALTARNYLGAFGYWLVISAGVLSMLSALQANLLAASRIGMSMARDRTLPKPLGRTHVKRSTPVNSIIVTAGLVILIVLVVPDVNTAGAAASLIFLLTFAIAHWTSILARVRGRAATGVFRTPLFPAIPVVGAMACLGLATFQGIAVPSAGVTVTVWLCVGLVAYLILFARHARVVDASSEAHDPELLRSRGRAPLVLVPIANPDHAESMVAVANALTPPGVGRVLLLTVVKPPEFDGNELVDVRGLDAAQEVLRGALHASFSRRLYPEALTTVSTYPWPEIVRVARNHRCESLLIGIGGSKERIGSPQVEDLIGKVDCDVVVLRARKGWNVQQVRRVLVPVGGRGGHDALRARLLGSLQRMGAREVTFLQVLPESAKASATRQAEHDLRRFAQDEVRGDFHVKIKPTADVAAAIATEAQSCELVILGLQRASRRHKFFGDVARSIARNTDCGLIMISRKG